MPFTLYFNLLKNFGFWANLRNLDKIWKLKKVKNELLKWFSQVEVVIKPALLQIPFIFHHYNPLSQINVVIIEGEWNFSLRSRSSNATPTYILGVRNPFKLEYGPIIRKFRISIFIASFSCKINVRSIISYFNTVQLGSKSQKTKPTFWGSVENHVKISESENVSP